MRPDLTVIFINAIVFGCLFGIATLIAANARRKRETEIMKMAIEKGQSIEKFEFSNQKGNSTLKWAMVFLAFGFGIILMVLFEEMFGWGGSSVGILPLLIGVALLISWKIDKIEAESKSE
jgi:hypothetical protein